MTNRFKTHSNHLFANCKNLPSDLLIMIKPFFFANIRKEIVSFS